MAFIKKRKMLTTAIYLNETREIKNVHDFMKIFLILPLSGFLFYTVEMIIL